MLFGFRYLFIWSIPVPVQAKKSPLANPVHKYPTSVEVGQGRSWNETPDL